MNTSIPSARPTLRAFAVAGALVLTLAACGGVEPDGSTDDAADVTGQLPVGGDGEDAATDQGVAEDEPLPSVDGGAGSSCMVGDEDCIDESNAGGDVSRIIAIVDGPLDGDDLARGESSGATGTYVEGAIVDGASVTLGWSGGACDVLQDVLITESETEVRVLVLTGMAADTEVCSAEAVQWQTTVTLDAELGDRVLLDLAG